MTLRRTLFLIPALAALVASALPPGPAGGQAAPCEQPYAPLAFAQSLPDNEELTSYEDVVDAVTVSRTLPFDTWFDSDGDGSEDFVDPLPGGGIRVTRGDGIVELTTSTDVELLAFWVGDIDGDGGDEFGVRLRGGVGDTIYLVPGSTTPGTYPLVDAGIDLGLGTSYLHLVTDGSGRLLRLGGLPFPGEEGATDVFDASAVLARGPGGDVTGLAPLVSVPAIVAYTADLGDPQEALVAFGDASAPGASAGEVSIIRGTAVTRLTTAPERYAHTPGEIHSASVTVLVGQHGTYVIGQHGIDNREEVYLWSLDDPCTPLVEVTEPPPTTDPDAPDAPTAPAARPVSTVARFTG